MWFSGLIALGLDARGITTAVTGPPPKDHDFKFRVIGGSRSPMSMKELGVLKNGSPRSWEDVAMRPPTVEKVSPADFNSELCLF
jgi:hypothetical protein